MISPQDRRETVTLVQEAAAAGARATEACRFIGLDYGTFCKWRDHPEDEDRRSTCERKPNRRSLSAEEKAVVIERLCRPDVCDLSPRQAFYKLLDQGEYYCSQSTIYRLFKETGLDVRRDGARPGVHRNKPTSFVATGPNQVWAWDITYLRDANYKTRFYYAFAIVDIYSRYVVHADVFDSETADNAVSFLSEAFDRHHIAPRQLVLHSDNGAAMKAAQTAALLVNRGVQISHSRPRVSDDNPYIESFFKTMKYMGHMGRCRFPSLEACRCRLRSFVRTYNCNMVHSGINCVTPACRFECRDGSVLEARRSVLEEAKRKHPERWIKGKVMDCSVAGPQCLNPDRLPEVPRETGQ